MELEKLQPRNNSTKGLEKQYLLFGDLLSELQKRGLPVGITESINGHIRGINDFKGTDAGLEKELKKSRNTILRLLEKELKLVPRNHYRNLWMVLGMTAFGLPMGVVFGLSIGNIGMMAVGMPIGLAIGLAVGSGMDQKANLEGRQLQIDA